MERRSTVAEFMQITGVSESVAVQKLEEYRGNLNDAINAHFLKGDRHISPDQGQNVAAAPSNKNLGIFQFELPRPLFSSNPPRSLTSYQAEMREGPAWINAAFKPHYQNKYPLAMSNTTHVPDAELEEAMLQAAIKASTVEGRGGSPREQIRILDDSSDDGLPQSHFQQEDDDLAHMTKQENAMRGHLVVEEKERLGAHDLLDKGKKISSSRSQLQGPPIPAVPTEIPTHAETQWESSDEEKEADDEGIKKFSRKRKVRQTKKVVAKTKVQRILKSENPEKKIPKESSSETLSKPTLSRKGISKEKQATTSREEKKTVATVQTKFIGDVMKSLIKPSENQISAQESGKDGFENSVCQREEPEVQHPLKKLKELDVLEISSLHEATLKENTSLGEKKKLAPDASSTLEKMSMFDPGRRKQFLSTLKEMNAIRHAINTTFKNTSLHIIPELKIPGETNVSLTKPALEKLSEKENSSIIPPDEAQDISEDIKQKSIAVASLGKSDIPNEDLDFDPKTTFSDSESDEDAKEECFFGILKEWSSGPSISRRALESDSGPHKTELEAKLSSFRELAYSDNFAVALSQPNFKTKIETTIEDLKSVNDMPAEIKSELKEFVLVFNKAFDLHLKNILVRESIEKIENDTAEDREKLAVVRTQVTSLKQSIKQIGPSLEKLKKQEQDLLMTIEALQRELSTNQAMQKNIQDEKNTMNKKHADLIDQARAISESLQEQLESKRKLEKDHSFLLTALQQEVKHHQELKEKYFH